MQHPSQRPLDSALLIIALVIGLMLLWYWNVEMMGAMSHPATHATTAHGAHAAHHMTPTGAPAHTPGLADLLGTPLHFLGMWIMMMAAMMLPAEIPALLRQTRLTCHQPHRLVRLLAFLTGYMSMWALMGAALYLLAALIWPWWSALTPDTIARLSAIACIGIGLYQLTPIKRLCMARHHQTPYFQPTDKQPGVALWQGITHGKWCLGSCGILMLLMLIVGMSNLMGMIAITLLVVVEAYLPIKSVRYTVAAICWIGAITLLT